ncbi:unnamed protein product [Tilletia controversa]|uniref:Hydrophobic surface binding protein A-domain-containing protein n=3 Tax=Tilletia TaxID=13289 RepID=A0A8X7MYV0_9BASI|nr:hypothetical protein CF336_g3628 [Tilletia laevis]KAE8202179.1 hypothetical protein CF328_g2367 [Tilletia controversa]KAE8261537.1 hypothetical protein A4X03_0g3168 [Tilletia caries]KAE8202008.1 hypothetical protein CF335_g3576 [Tilletia laevis]KAE8252950.1 hypothetical protein A4X06_0g1801 [Tilletia controversa]
MRFNLLAFLPAFALFSIVSAGADTVNGHITDLVTSINGLNTQLHRPNAGTSYAAALGVNTAARKLISDLHSATAFVHDYGQLSDDEASAALDNMGVALPIVQNATTTVAGLKPQFTKLNLFGIARADVLKLQSATSDFMESIVDAVPSADVADAKLKQAAYNAALADAASAYSTN